jgi:hypothetical protein
MHWDRMRHELRLIGIGAYALPIGVVAIYLGFSLMVRSFDLGHGWTVPAATFQTGRGLLALLENGLPLAAGLLAALIAAPDPALELHLSLPVSYRATIGRRLGLVTVWAVATAAMTSAAIVGMGYWIVPVDQPLGQLTWIAPVLWYSGAGAMLTLLLRSWVAGSAVVGMTWIAQFMFKDLFLHSQVLVRFYPFLTQELIPGITQANASLWFIPWVQNRLILLAMALAMLLVVALLLGRNESLLGHET